MRKIYPDFLSNLRTINIVGMLPIILENIPEDLKSIAIRYFRTRKKREIERNVNKYGEIVRIK